MQTHNLARRTKNYKAPAVGRGGKRGKTSGRGTKGQNARAGRKKRPEMRDFIKRLPKLRGYAFASIQDKAFPVNLRAIEKAYSAGEKVNPATLISKGVVEFRGGRKPIVKILSVGEMTKKVIVSGCKVSATAKAKIEKAGGTVSE